MHVEIWSDIACPWCYVGKRRFEAALAGVRAPRRRAGDLALLRARPGRAAPSASGDSTQHLADKYGMSRDEALAAQQRLTDVAAGEGLAFRFDRRARRQHVRRPSRAAPRAEHGLQDAMKERIMRAYLEEGELISSAEVLARLADEVGLPADEVADVLAGDRYADEVRDDERTAAGLGIHAVPFFVVDRKLGASGAQPAPVLLDLLRQAWPARAGGRRGRRRRRDLRSRRLLERPATVGSAP